MIFKSTILYALAAIGGVFAEDKAETGCRPCDAPCRRRRSESTAKLAGEMLLKNMCTALETKNLAALQGGIVTPKTTLQTIFSSPVGCVDSGVQNYLATIITFFPVVDFPTPPTIVDSYSDGNGRVVVYADNEIVRAGQNLTVHSRWIFESVDGQCEFKILEGVIVDSLCSN